MISYKKIFHGFIWLLFFSFLVLYFAQAGGYYEDLNNKKASLTEEKVKQFKGFKWGMNNLFNGIDKMVNE